MYEQMVPWGFELYMRALRFGDRVAVVDRSGEYSYQDLANRAHTVARHVLAKGFEPGTPVASLVPNSFLAIAVSYGVVLAAAAETPINTYLNEAEILHCLQVSGAKCLVTTRSFAERIKWPSALVLLILEDILDDQPYPLEALSQLNAAASSWGRVVFTSGTTGKPKAIINTHGRRWLANQLLRSHMSVRPGPEDALLLMTPFAFGASLLAYAYLESGAKIYIEDGVDVARVNDLLRTGGVTAMFAPPTVLAKLTSQLEDKKYAGLNVIYCGTSSLLPESYRRARALFGPVIRITYGKSEIYNPITVMQPDDCDAFYQSDAAGHGAVKLGWPASGVEIEIRGDAEQPLANGEIGEINLRAQHIMVGYVDPKGFHAVLPDTWHDTGDLGYLDAQGALFLTGRVNDVIKSGGYKIYPQEIEDVIASANREATTVVVGLTSAYWGQVIVAVTERADEGWEQRARTLAKDKLSSFKQPRKYITLEALPRGSQDKIQRARVIDVVMEQYRLVDGPSPQLVTAAP